MARFRFRLESVLEHRRLVEMQHQRHVAEIEQERRTLEDRIRSCQQRLLAERDSLRAELVQAGTLDVNRLRLQASVSNGIVAQAERSVVELAGVHARLKEARAGLLKATTERKAVERLRERAVEAWRLRERKREERELDELNVMRAGKDA